MDTRILPGIERLAYQRRADCRDTVLHTSPTRFCTWSRRPRRRSASPLRSGPQRFVLDLAQRGASPIESASASLKSFGATWTCRKRSCQSWRCGRLPAERGSSTTRSRLIRGRGSAFTLIPSRRKPSRLQCSARACVDSWTRLDPMWITWPPAQTFRWSAPSAS
uniref:Uncharacterized protein n=1 Tax=uncultured marine virus TaxID=186617 RepID=A0A0F7L306_9VIRU|nr:hypothetical protein [uncultured marine virus]